MGVKGLKKELRSRGLVHDVCLSNFANKKMGVDISCFMYKYKVSDSTRWKDRLLKLIVKLKESLLHCTFVFDGKPPEDKDKEKQHRREAKENITTTVESLRKDLTQYVSTGEISPLLRETSDKLMQSNKVKRLLRQSNIIDIEKIEGYITDKTSQGISITREDTADVKKLLDTMCIKYIQAPSEAESLAAYLAFTQQLYGIITEDTDVLCYGTERYISNIDVSNNRCDAVYLSEVLENLNISKESFVDFCIMCKVDYNDNIPNVGIKKSYDIICKYGDIDNYALMNPDVDISMLRHVRCREIFHTFNGLVKDRVDEEYEKANKVYKTFYWEVVLDFENVYKQLKEMGVKFYRTEIEDAWKPVEVEFEIE